MSEFSIECAVCAIRFSEEALYEQHDCHGHDVPLAIKLEAPDDEEDEERDVKPVLNSAGQVVDSSALVTISVTDGTSKVTDGTRTVTDGTSSVTCGTSSVTYGTSSVTYGTSTVTGGTSGVPGPIASTTSVPNKLPPTLEKFRMRLALGTNKQRKPKKKPKGNAKLTNNKSSSSKIANEKTRKLKDIQENNTEDAELAVPVVNIKAEPIELCEVVNVKEEPVEYDDETAPNIRDPLENSVEDILGIEDEDYMIENFVEYDEEMSESMEIDEGAISDDSESPTVKEGSLIPAVRPSTRGKPIDATDNKGYACSMCDKKYFEESKLEDHLKVAHKTPRPYSCPICNKRFNHKNYVNLHMRVHTGEKPYKCNLCSRSYSHKTSYVIHMRIHKGDRPYSCSECGKKCYDKSGLTSHMRSHTKETPYQCECCGRKFTHSKSLLVHRRNHTGEKPYVCPHCGRAFRHWHKHKIHIRLHTGERPYKCTVCNKGFPRNDEVKRHMRSHTGIKSFRCSICGVYCATQASITGHINLHHVNLTTDSKYLPDKTIVENSQSGILGKKAMPGRGLHRVFDNTSYDEYTTSIPEKPALPGPVPQTIVSSKPMTPQEKVNNKSMTYRQFLNDQEQELLAKGLKVVSKNDNTYGLAPVSPKSSGSLDSAAVKVKSEPGEEKKEGIIDNVFVKVPHSRKSSFNSPKPATRIILPNGPNGNQPLVLGEVASKLFLKSTQASPHKIQPNSKPKTSLLEENVSPTPTSPAKSRQDPTVKSSAPTTTSTSGSILQAALTAGKPTTPVTESIIVLNKGMSGGGSSEGVATNAPMVVLTQPQQLLLLPGINGGPARLVFLQSSPAAMIRSHPNINGVTGSDNITIKQEKDAAPVVHIEESSAPLFMFASPPNVIQESPVIKLEPPDFDTQNIKLEKDDEEASETSEVVPPLQTFIKPEPED
ncbi:hypothetical protein HAZT_HAZT002062 [Hyalella azteca]|uniref:RE1-silencing transcription factor n=1 Tax=Hyalella azteca TaxID=294128 RepID=A0A6A0GXM8_HYAAZ|nr:RE1-silencing transcription factor [Hyalella azteca]KAA0191882.1 hypothetical protein HAZT_HAZT002062 [Hyalella azteca]